MPDLLATPWTPLEVAGAVATTRSLTALDAAGDFANYAAVSASAWVRSIAIGDKVRGIILRPYANAQDAVVPYSIAAAEQAEPVGGEQKKLSLHTLATGNIDTNGGLQGNGSLLPIAHYYGHTVTLATPAAADSPAASRLSAYAPPAAAVHSPGIAGNDKRGEIYLPDLLGIDRLILSWNDAASQVGWLYRLLT